MYEVREMMFGLRESFEYVQCGVCGCLQIAEFPRDLDRFYPPGYYAHTPLDGDDGSRLRRMLRSLRNRYAFTGKGLVGRLLFHASPYPIGEVFRWSMALGLTPDSRILDVGCGAGRLLHDLASQGFRHLLGVDPFIDEDLDCADGVRLRRATVHEIEGPFDLIMLNHSFEHIPDQLETMRSIARLLNVGGSCIVRVPVSDSYAWNRYRENWVQLDAPRHFHLHTTESMRTLAARAGLVLKSVVYDSTELQFVGSEMYERDVPLTTSSDGLFTRSEMRAFHRRARQLNREGRGDSAAFLLVRDAGG